MRLLRNPCGNRAGGKTRCDTFKAGTVGGWYATRPFFLGTSVLSFSRREIGVPFQQAIHQCAVSIPRVDARLHSPTRRGPGYSQTASQLLRSRNRLGRQMCRTRLMLRAEGPSAPRTSPARATANNAVRTSAVRVLKRAERDSTASLDGARRGRHCASDLCGSQDSQWSVNLIIATRAVNCQRRALADPRFVTTPTFTPDDRGIRHDGTRNPAPIKTT